MPTKPIPVFFAFLIACFIPISAATKPILLSASIWEIDCEIFLIFIFGLGLINFLLILSQYIFNLDNPWVGASTNSALIIAFAQIKACSLLNLCFLKMLMILLFKTLWFTFNLCHAKGSFYLRYICISN